MNDAAPRAEGVSYQDALPLSWALLDAPLPDAEQAHLQELNLRVLATVSTLEERRVRGDQPVDAEIERLHHKVDVLLEMTGALLRVHYAAPRASPLRLSREGVTWIGSTPPPDGSRVQLSLHLHPCAIDPFTWTAQVTRAGDETCARFEPLGEAVAAALEKHVFMHHRRSVAGLRQPASR